MRLSFTYSFTEELRESINMLLHPSEYRDLRSVVWPWPWNIFRVAFTPKRYQKHTETVWNNARPRIEAAFSKADIKDLGSVTCSVHGVSCEGWFDTDANAIHVRVTDVLDDRELLDSIVHELLHLATYDEKLSYDEREDLVDQYLSKIH